MTRLLNKIRKHYFHLRSSLLSSNKKPNRLIIEKAKWYNNADSPVMFMIDDFANAWHSKNGNNSWDQGGDWGGGLSKRGSVFSFLMENLLDDFPEVKVTFFVVAGKISHYTNGHPFSFAEPLDFSEESRAFFRKVSDDDRFEIAYHGYNHGTPGQRTEDFIQEWRGFHSVEEACYQTEKGMEIFKDVFGRYPSGGKYGGWDYNHFADESVDRSFFLWWCRDWTPRDRKDRVHDGYYEPQFFGRNWVVALPSTIHGFFWSKGQIDKLIEKKQIISVEEHIAPIRPDGRIQTPNIIDDHHELRSLFSYLRGKNVWYAMGTEIAKYFIGYSQSIIYDARGDSFKIKYHGKVDNPILTLIIDCTAICSPEKPLIEVVPPDGIPLPGNQIIPGKNYRHMVNLPVTNGKYSISPVEKVKP